MSYYSDHKYNVNREALDPTNLYFKQLGLKAILTIEEEVSLFQAHKKGQKKAYDKLIECNLRLVIKIAKRYQNRGLPFLDLIAEGNMGLMHAIEKYDPQKGLRLATYATWWIKQNIELAIMNQSRNIRIPVPAIKKLSRYMKIKRKLVFKYERNYISHTEIATVLNEKQHTVTKLMKHRLDTQSLDIKQYDNDSSRTIADSVTKGENEDPEKILCHKEMYSHIESWIEALDEISQTILMYRFGLNGSTRYTIKETADILNVSPEKIRRIQLQSIKKLRTHLANKGIINPPL